MTVDFYPSERKIIRSLLIKSFGKQSKFLDQLRTLRCSARKMTGTGYYLDFLANERTAPVDNMNEELTEGLSTKLRPPQGVVGFTLFIRNGRISWFEGYTYGDVAWPDEPMEEWLILDPVETPHQKAK